MADLLYVWLADLEGWAAKAVAFTDNLAITHTPNPAQAVVWEAADGIPANGCIHITQPGLAAAPDYQAIAHIVIPGGWTIPADGFNASFYAKSNDGNTPWVTVYFKITGVGWRYSAAVKKAGPAWGVSTVGYWGPIWAGSVIEEVAITVRDDTIWYPKSAVDVSVDSLLFEDIGGGGPILPPGSEHTVTIGTNMAIDADGTQLYIGALTTGAPRCLKIAALLNADGSVVYNPGAGDYIEVACGRLDPDRVWVNGNFGIPKLRLSEDGGTTWATIDPAWAGVNYVCPVWPWALIDEGVTVMTHDQRDAYETDDDGVSWTALQPTLPFTVGAFDILDIDPVEAVLGAYAAGANRVNLTVNNFSTFYNLTAGTPNARVTKVIVG